MSDGAPSATPGWAVTSASHLGSVHQRDHRPLQDSARTWASGPHAVLAVADGHGHHLHFRSDVGSALATRVALAVLRDAVAEWHAAGLDADAVAALLPEVGARVVAGWTEAVEAHVAEHPFGAADPLDRGSPQRRLLPYGTTLLVVAVTDRLLAALQVGDGDTVAVRASGEAFRPLPDDAAHDGVHTASLCQPDPLGSLRCAALDLAAEDVVLAFACTDGFSGPQADQDGWWRETGAQLVGFGREHGMSWIGAQLPSWLQEPAMVGGDDTTMAVVASTALGPAGAPPTVPVDLPVPPD